MTGRHKGNPRQDLIRQGASASTQPTPEETETSILADQGYLNILTTLCEVMLKSTFDTEDFSVPTLCWAPSPRHQGGLGTRSTRHSDPTSSWPCLSPPPQRDMLYMSASGSIMSTAFGNLSHHWK